MSDDTSSHARVSHLYDELLFVLVMKMRFEVTSDLLVYSLVARSACVEPY